VFQGRKALASVLAELERQKAARKDIVINTSKLKFRIHAEQLVMEVKMTGCGYVMPVTHRVFVQLAHFMGIRMTDGLYRWLSEGHRSPGTKKGQTIDRTRNWQIWCDLLNAWFNQEKMPVLVRMMSDNSGQLYCRAILSDKYQVIPNADFFYAVADAIRDLKPGGKPVEIWHARLSEDRFYLYAVAPGISGQVSTDRIYDPGDGFKGRWIGRAGDVYNAAMTAGNSETGEGGCSLTQAVLRRATESYQVWHDIVNKAHIGKRNDVDQYLSDATLKMRNEYFFSKIKDLVKRTFDPELFQEMIDAMNGAVQDEVLDADVALDVVALVYNISEERKKEIRNLFIRSCDNSRYGLASAMVEAAGKDTTDPDTGYGLENTAAELILNTNMRELNEKAGKMRQDKRKAKDAAPVDIGVSVLDECFEV
jgi:hypothetical protein